MATPKNIREIFPTVEAILDQEPEELGLMLLQNAPAHYASGEKFHIGSFHSALFPVSGAGSAFDQRYSAEVMQAIAEAFLALENLGLITEDTGQSGATVWRVATRRAKNAMRGDRDLSSFARTHLLPHDLLHPKLRETAYALFSRGDYDTAVFKAFREVEVAVRDGANRRGASYTGLDYGVPLMGKAFHAESGPLADLANPVKSERDAIVALFTGAMGHAKNPPGHRDVNMTAVQAARLIAFASHLLDIVAERAP